MRNALEIRKVLGGIVLALLLDCIFLFIKPTLAIDWGFGLPLMSLQLVVLLVGLLIVVLYHLYYRSSATTTRLSLTSMFTVIWLSLIVFFPFNPPATASDTVKSSWNGSAVAFFVLISGLALSVLWVHFFSDEFGS
ncbi:MAG TPA: hypothetical protein VNG51_14085 [Ktedonobacteraceae bacterium]|nr:hypothetical protein [Ktedonobacteraceae bacterium]